jgi:hypothetical protein
MPNVGDTKARFGRQYIYLNPAPNGTGTIGEWRLRIDDNGQPPITPGGGTDLGYQAVVATGQPTIVAGNLIYLDSAGEAKLADASTITESVVASAGALVEFTRNEIKTIFNVSTVVEGAPTNLVPGSVYYLSTTAGKWTTTPNATTAGSVIRSCGTAVDIDKMSIEIQIVTSAI